MSAALLLSSWTAQAPSPSIGFALTVHGPWRVDGAEVKQGQALAPGRVILLAPGAIFKPGELYTITVVLLNNQSLSQSCGSPDACRPGLALPGSLTGKTSALARLAEVFKRMFERPERYVAVMSRGMETTGANLADGIAKLEAGRLDLAPLLQSVSQARYRVHLRPISDEGSDPAESTLELDWDQRPASAILTTSLTPGLHVAHLSRGGVLGREAWILVTDRAREAGARAAFDEVARAARAWNGAPAADVESFLRAYLAQLASQMR